MAYETMPNFGAMPGTTQEDSEKFATSREDNAVGQNTEGGYTISRPKNGQPARRLFETGFGPLNNVQKEQLEEFDNRVGTIKPFYYQHPRNGELILCQLQERLKFSYIGKGTTARWNVTLIKLREV